MALTLIHYLFTVFEVKVSMWQLFLSALMSWTQKQLMWTMRSSRIYGSFSKWPTTFPDLDSWCFALSDLQPMGVFLKSQARCRKELCSLLTGCSPVVFLKTFVHLLSAFLHHPFYSGVAGAVDSPSKTALSKFMRLPLLQGYQELSQDTLTSTMFSWLS